MMQHALLWILKDQSPFHKLLVNYGKGICCSSNETRLQLADSIEGLCNIWRAAFCSLLTTDISFCLPKVQLLAFITGTVDLGSENNAIPSTPSTPSNRTSQFKEEVRCVIFALYPQLTAFLYRENCYCCYDALQFFILTIFVSEAPQCI